jgi:hypothetical protein
LEITTSVTPSSFEIPEKYHLLDNRAAEPSPLFDVELGWMRMQKTLTFGTTSNVEKQATSIHVPKTSLTSCNITPTTSGQERANLLCRLRKGLHGNSLSDNGQKSYYEIKRSEPARHGMA